MCGCSYFFSFSQWLQTVILCTAGASNGSITFARQRLPDWWNNFFHLWHENKVFLLFVLYEALSTLFLNLYAVAYVGVPVGKPHVFFTLMPNAAAYGNQSRPKWPWAWAFFHFLPLERRQYPIAMYRNIMLQRLLLSRQNRGRYNDLRIQKDLMQRL